MLTNFCLYHFQTVDQIFSRYIHGIGLDIYLSVKICENIPHRNLKISTQTDGDSQSLYSHACKISVMHQGSDHTQNI